jgi:hypothetical protein
MRLMNIFYYKNGGIVRIPAGICYTFGMYDQARPALL